MVYPYRPPFNALERHYCNGGIYPAYGGGITAPPMVVVWWWIPPPPNYTASSVADDTEPDTPKIDADTASFDHELNASQLGNVISLSYLCNVAIMHRLINHGHGQTKTSVVADTQTPCNQAQVRTESSTKDWLFSNLELSYLCPTFVLLLETNKI